MIGWLLDTTLYTGLLIAAVLLLRRPVAQAFGAQAAYALWALPLLRLALPPIVLPACFAPQAEGDTLAVAPPMLTAADADLANDPAASAGELVVMLAWSEILLSVWLGGALAFLGWRIVSYRQMRRDALAGARPVGEVGAIRLVETPAVGAPVAFGLFDKVIALPALFMAYPDREGRDLAIAHELAHHRGYDLLANFAAQLLLALHWWNPLAWLGWRAMRRDQEAACDARVMAGRGREERARYAALIASFAAGPRLTLDAPMACPMLGEASILHRLRSLSRPDPSARRRWAGRGLLVAGALALPLTASISYAAGRDASRARVPPAPLAHAKAPYAAPVAPAAPTPMKEPAALSVAEANAPPTPVTKMRSVVPAPDGVRRDHERVSHARDAQIPHRPNVTAAFERRMEEFVARMENFDSVDEREIARIEREAERIERTIERDAARMEHDLERAIERDLESQLHGVGPHATATAHPHGRHSEAAAQVAITARQTRHDARHPIAGRNSLREDVRLHELEDGVIVLDPS